MNVHDGFLSGKNVFILGGSSGFGLEIARLAHLEGARLIIVGRDANKAEQVAETLHNDSGDSVGYGLDARDDSALQSLLNEIGTVDHAVSMLGGAMGGGFLQSDPDIIRSTIEEKFFANLQIARTIVPYLTEDGTLTLTSGSGGRPDNASGAIIGNEGISTLVRGLAVELAPKVRVNAVAPTWTPTPLWRSVPVTDLNETQINFSQQIPLRRTAEPREVAIAYLFLMNCGFITGQTITVDGGLTLIT